METITLIEKTCPRKEAALLPAPQAKPSGGTTIATQQLDSLTRNFIEKYIIL